MAGGLYLIFTGEEENGQSKKSYFQLVCHEKSASVQEFGTEWVKIAKKYPTFCISISRAIIVTNYLLPRKAGRET